MATLSLEERLEALETQVKRLEKQYLFPASQSGLPWWEQIRGTFQDDPAYDEAMRLGREYRESLRPKADEEIEC